MTAGPWLCGRATSVCNTQVSSMPRLYSEIEAAEWNRAMNTKLISPLGAFFFALPAQSPFAPTGLIFGQPEIHLQKTPHTCFSPEVNNVKIGGGYYMDLGSICFMVTSKVTITTSPELAITVLSHPLFNPK